MTAWPHAAEVDQYSKLRPTDVDTLLISGDLDFATPAEFATNELLPTLRHGHQVVLHNLGHTGDTWTYETAASSRLINTYFDTGRVDDSAYPQRRMSFDVTPGQPWLAKIVVASFAGLAAFSLLALALLPLRLRRRTSVGTKTGVVTRAVVAPLAGLGGWCLGLLAVLVLWPSMSVGSRPLAVLSIGVPVALLTYLGWVHRDWSALGADGGAVRGDGRCGARGVARPARGGRPDVRVTAVLGAVLLANLAVLVRDMVAGTPSARPQHRGEVATAGAGDDHGLRPLGRRSGNPYLPYKTPPTNTRSQRGAGLPVPVDRHPTLPWSGRSRSAAVTQWLPSRHRLQQARCRSDDMTAGPVRAYDLHVTLSCRYVGAATGEGDPASAWRPRRAELRGRTSRSG